MRVLGKIVCFFKRHNWSAWYSKIFPGIGYRYCWRCGKSQEEVLG